MITDQKSFDGPYFPDTEVSASPFLKIVHDTYQKTRGKLMSGLVVKTEML